MNTTIITSAGASILFTLTSGNLVAEDSSDKSGFHLFNPTPREQMRELSPDRPDATESAKTVDAGRFVIEASLGSWSKNGGDESFTLMATNFKMGLTNNTDLQVVFDSYTRENPLVGNSSSSFGDVQLRLKHNLWGNDIGDTALALFPYVKIPTGTKLSNNVWEGGLIIPFSKQLTDKSSLGLMAEIDVVYDDTTFSHKFEFLHSAVYGVDVTEKVGAYLEYIGIISESSYQAYMAGGLTYSVSDDLVLDIGSQVGLNSAADDFGIFTGFTKRF